MKAMLSRGGPALAMLPGIALCAALTLVAVGLEGLELALLGRAWIDALVIAILLGAFARTAWSPGRLWEPGITFSAKTLLEIAVVLLGASLSAAVIAAAGLALLLGIAAIVAVALTASFAIGRWLGLPWRMAMLIACGNAICGNSAIAAVAPVIGADSKDVASAIAFTAVLGVGVVLLLPLLGLAIGMGAHGYGIVAGLTVYAVPQVLAATVPVSASAAQIGTLVKLVRVLMLGPVVVALSLFAARSGRNPPIYRLVPWFVIGFILMAAARTLGLIADPLLGPIADVAGVLMILAMAALGLGVDVRSIAAAGPRISLVVILSLVVLVLAALLLVNAIGMYGAGPPLSDSVR